MNGLFTEDLLRLINDMEREHKCPDAAYCLELCLSGAHPHEADVYDYLPGVSRKLILIALKGLAERGLIVMREDPYRPRLTRAGKEYLHAMADAGGN